MFEIRNVLAICLALAAPAALGLQVAVVDIEIAIANTEQAKAYGKKLNEEFKDQIDEVRKLAKKLGDLQEKMQRDRDVLSATDLSRMGGDLDELNQEYKYKVGKLQRERNKRQQDLMGQLGPLLDKALKEIIETDKYDLVLQRCTQIEGRQCPPTQTVLFSTPTLDITKRVTAKLNEAK